MNDKRTKVRSRAVLGDVFKLAEKLDEGSSVEAIASTALDEIQKAKDQGNERIIRMAELEEMLGISKQAIYARIRRGTFPKPVPLGGIGSNRRVGWLMSEVKEWLREKAKGR